MDWIGSITSEIDKLNNLSAGALVFASCIAFGYLLRFIKSFPNDRIPLAVVACGAICCMCAAPRTELELRIWLVRNLLVGIVIGFAAWLSHNLILSRIEDRLGLFAPKGDGQTKDPDPKSGP